MNKIKVLMVAFLLLTQLSLVIGQDNKEIKEHIKKNEFSELPFISTEKNTPRPWYISENNRQGLPLYGYDDLRGITQIAVDYCEIFNYFDSTNGDYKIFLISLGEYENFRDLLVTYDPSAKLISLLEVSYKFDVFRNLKQWKLNKDMTLEVYNIKILSPDRVSPSFKNDFKELKGQRIDTYYQIDSLGHFKKEKEILYEPEMYPRSYFRGDEERPIWNGKEKVEKEEVY